MSTPALLAVQDVSKRLGDLCAVDGVSFDVRLEPAIENPDALWVVIISQIPFFSPFLIPGRCSCMARR